MKQCLPGPEVEVQLLGLAGGPGALPSLQTWTPQRRRSGSLCHGQSAPPGDTRRPCRQDGSSRVQAGALPASAPAGPQAGCSSGGRGGGGGSGAVSAASRSSAGPGSPSARGAGEGTEGFAEEAVRPGLRGASGAGGGAVETGATRAPDRPAHATPPIPPPCQAWRSGHRACCHVHLPDVALPTGRSRGRAKTWLGASPGPAQPPSRACALRCRCLPRGPDQASFVGGGQGADPRPRLRADRSTWRGRVPGRWWQRLAVAARLCSVGRWGRGCARFPTLCSQSAAEGTKQSRGCWAALVSRPHRPACETGLGLGAHVGRQGTRRQGTRPASKLCPPAVTEQRPVARAGPGCWAGGSGRSWELSNQGSSLSDASCPSSRHRTHVPAGHPLVTVCPPEPRLAPPSGPLSSSHLTVALGVWGRCCRAWAYLLGDKSSCSVSPGCGSHTQTQHGGGVLARGVGAAQRGRSPSTGPGPLPLEIPPSPSLSERPPPPGKARPPPGGPSVIRASSGRCSGQLIPARLPQHLAFFDS